MGMNRLQPELHLHSTGVWYAKWGGKFHYFGRDEEAARAAWLTDPVRGLQAWAAWRADRDTRRFAHSAPMNGADAKYVV